MPITRTMLNTLATTAMDILGETSELVTFVYQSAAGSTFVSITNLRAKLSRYTKREVDAAPVLRDARRCRIPWETLTTGGGQLEPTRHCLVTRSNGEVWKVDEIEDGDHRPNWFLQLTRVK